MSTWGAYIMVERDLTVTWVEVVRSQPTGRADPRHGGNGRSGTSVWPEHPVASAP